MQRLGFLITALLASAIAGCADLPLPTPPPPKNQEADAITLEIPEEVECRYLIYLPEDYASQDDWPLILFLHGTSEQGDNPSLITRFGIPRMIEMGYEFPFVIASPQIGEDEDWDPAFVIAFLDYVQANYDVDPARTYMTGVSKGGFATWNVARAYPDRFAAIAPIAGGAFPWVAIWLKDMPTWAFNIRFDPFVRWAYPSWVARVMERLGAEILFTVYPRIGHNAWAQAYRDPELYKWFLSHRL